MASTTNNTYRIFYYPTAPASGAGATGLASGAMQSAVVAAATPQAAVTAMISDLSLTSPQIVNVQSVDPQPITTYS